MARHNGRLSKQTFVLSAPIRRKSYVSVGGLKSLLNPFAQTGFTAVSRTGIRDWKRKWYQPVIREECDPSWECIYVEWWDGGPVFAGLAETESQSKMRNFSWRRKAKVSFFSFSPVFVGRDGLTVARFHPYLDIGPKQPKKTGCTGPAPYSGLVN